MSEPAPLTLRQRFLLEELAIGPQPVPKGNSAGRALLRASYAKNGGPNLRGTPILVITEAGKAALKAPRS
jgi:hypothetical protein